MIELSAQQGTPEWKASRKNTRNASDYPSAQGLSKKFGRADLVKEAATGIEREFSPFVEEKIFPDGHRIEALARPIAEQIIGEELFPIVATSDDGYLGASSDGATMLLDTGWECKQWNIELAEAVASTGRIPETHVGQLDQQGLVFGFERILFMVTDGTPEKCVHCWHTPTDEAKAKIRPTWKQFDEDVAEYQHVEAVAKPVAENVEGLPALFVQVEGRVVASNMDAFKCAAELFLSRLPKADQLKGDQDFVNADQAAKDCKDAEERLQVVKAQAQSQATSIDEVFRAIDSISEKIRTARLSLENVVKAEKENRKNEIVGVANKAMYNHIVALHERVGVQFKPEVASFADAIKGLKSLDSMRNAVSASLANAKVEASQIADRIEFNQKQMQAQSAAVLFPDFIQVCTKAPDDFAAIVAMRVAANKEANEKLLAEQREKIRREVEEDAARAAAVQDSDIKQSIQIVSACLDEMVDQVSGSGKTIKLGEINAMLSPVSVNADGLASLGIHPVAHEKNAKLFDANKFPTICRLISEHVMAQAFKKAA